MALIARGCVMSRVDTGSAAIHAIARGNPELALIAAVVERGLTDAKSGDTDAIEWLGSDTCAWYCGHLAPDGVEASEIQAVLIQLTQKG
jgi:hypothetical protein